MLLFFVKMGGGVLQNVSQSHTEDTSMHKKALSLVSFLVAKSVNGSGGAIDAVQSFVLVMTSMIILESLLLVSFFDVPTVLLIVGIVGMVSATISVLIMRSGSFIGSFRAISTTIIASMVMSALLVPGAVYWFGGDIPETQLFILYGCMVIGLVMSGSVMFTHYYYTATFRAMRRIVQASKENDISAFIRSIGVGLESVAIPALSVSIALVGGYMIGDMYGVLAVVAGFLLIMPLLLVLYFFALFAPSSILDSDDSSSYSVAQFLENAQQASLTITRGYGFFIACIASILLFLSIGYSVVSQEQHLIASFVAVPYFVSGILLGCCAAFLFLSGVLSLAIKVSHRITERIKTYQADKREEYRIKDFSWITDTTSRLVQKESLYPLFLLLAATPLVIVTLKAQAVTGFVVGVIACSFLLSFSLFILGVAWSSAHHSVSSGKNDLARSQRRTIRYIASATDIFKEGIVEAMSVFMKTVVALAFLLLPFVL